MAVKWPRTRSVADRDRHGQRQGRRRVIASPEKAGLAGSRSPGGCQRRIVLSAEGRGRRRILAGATADCSWYGHELGQRRIVACTSNVDAGGECGRQDQTRGQRQVVRIHDTSARYHESCRAACRAKELILVGTARDEAGSDMGGGHQTKVEANDCS